MALHPGLGQPQPVLGRLRHARRPRPGRGRARLASTSAAHSSSSRSAARRSASSRTELGAPGDQPRRRLDADAPIRESGVVTESAVQGPDRSLGRPGRTRSSRCTTTWLRRPIHSAARSARSRTRPLAKTLPSGPDDLDRVVGPEVAARPPTTPAARSERPRSASADRRPLVDDEAPRGAEGEGDPQLAGREAAAAGPGTRSRRRAPRPARRPARPGGAASAMTVSTPDQVAILAAASFEAMPPLPDRAARAAGQLLELVVDLDHLFDQRRLGVAAGVGGEQARRVGEQHEQVRARPGGPPAPPGGRCRRSGSPRRPRRRSR